jgi:carbonic anhydrase
VSADTPAVERRRFLSTALGACTVSPTLGFFSKEQRDSMTPLQVMELKKRNKRFRTAKMAPRYYLPEKRSSARGQYPAAVVLGCVDSRVPAEIVFEAGIGDTLNGRVAGNVVNDDLLGSMEFACAVSGAKLVLVLAHTACGAVKGAIDEVVLGNLTGLFGEN